VNTYIVFDTFEPFGVTLLNMLAPEFLGFEKLSAPGCLATEFGVIFLLHILKEFILKRFFHGLATQFGKISVLGF
jgi:hypothetical protein